MKKVAHVLAVTLAAIAGFFLTPAGKALLMQYPFLMPISMLLAGALTYFNPKTVVKALVFCFLLVGLGAHAQSTPSLGTYQFGVGYSSVGGPTDNGTLLTFAKQFSPHFWGQAKGFLLANPSGVTITTVGPRYRHPICRAASAYFDCTKWIPFADGNIGAVKDPTGATKFAYGAGIGLDYQANNTLTLLIGEADYIRSRFFPTGGILVTNVHTISAGLKISF